MANEKVKSFMDTFACCRPHTALGYDLDLTALKPSSKLKVCLLHVFIVHFQWEHDKLLFHSTSQLTDQFRLPRDCL